VSFITGFGDRPSRSTSGVSTFCRLDQRAGSRENSKFWIGVRADRCFNTRSASRSKRAPTRKTQNGVLPAATRRKRREAFDWINELTGLLIQAWTVQTPRQEETARRLAVQTWLQRNGLLSVSHNPKVLPIFPEQIAHN
jgi:hypothetical protein